VLLILTSSGDVTADYLADILSRERVDFVRLDTDQLVQRVRISYEGFEPRIQLDDRWIAPGDVKSIWYRRPEPLCFEPPDDSPEARFALSEWSECLEGFFARVPPERWINHPTANFEASHKLEQLHLAQTLGFNVPDTLVTQDTELMRRFFAKHHGKVIIKPVSQGQVEESDGSAKSLIYTNLVREEDLLDLSDLERCPTFFQQFVPKESDVRITVVDREMHAVRLLAKEPDGTQRCDVRRNNMVDVLGEMVEIPPGIVTKIRGMMRRYRLRFGAIDMAIATGGEWWFFEINPNGQWAWLDMTTGTDIARSLLHAFSQSTAVV